MASLGTYTWQIRAAECNPSGFATLPALLNLLQEAASLNAEELGFSKSNFAGAGLNISWVLTRLRLDMSRYPRWEDAVTIVTWPRKGRKITALRDFELFLGAERIGAATTEWMIIDLATRRASVIPPAVFGLANDERQPALGDAEFSRLAWNCKERGADALSFRAKRSDIDLNGHVNNVHYAEWFLETVPESAGVCRSCEIVFRSETLAGEEVFAEGVETAPGEFIHRVSAPDGRDHVLAQTLWAPA